MRDENAIFARLAQSTFRSRFHLGLKSTDQRQYIVRIIHRWLSGEMSR